MTIMEKGMKKNMCIYNGVTLLYTYISHPSLGIQLGEQGNVKGKKTWISEVSQILKVSYINCVEKLELK